MGPDAPQPLSRMGRRVACAGVALLLLFRMGPTVADPDLWHEMALAREAIARGHIPWADHFAYTPTRYPVVHHEWGAGVIAYALASGLGGRGIVVLRYGLTLALAAVTIGAARRRGAGLPVLTFLAPLAILLIDDGFSAVRAQLYSFVCFALMLAILGADRRAGRHSSALLLLPLFLLWINVHAGFLLGAGVLAVHGVERMARGERPWHLAAIGLGIAALIGANPYGIYYYEYLLRAATMRRALVSEWRPLWRGGDPVDVALFAVAVAVAVYAVAGVGVRGARGLPILCVTALAGLLRARLTQFFAVAWLVYVPGWVQATPLGASMEAFYRRRGGFLVGVWGLAGLLLLGRLVPMRPWEIQVPGGPVPAFGKHISYPVGAVDYLAANGFRGNVLVPFEWGAYVSWRLHPAVKVAVDGRYEVAYPERVVEENYRVFMGRPGWEEVLAADPAVVVLIPTHLPLARLMPRAPGWRRVYSDRAFVLYARPGPTLPAVDRGDRTVDGTFP